MEFLQAALGVLVFLFIGIPFLKWTAKGVKRLKAGYSYRSGGAKKSSKRKMRLLNRKNKQRGFNR